jgi:sugar/nucleoside kinase (ribokinase family)
MVDFVCIGDATQDNFFFVSDASVHCDLNNANCELTLRYGDKIPVERIGQSLGGNAANVSVGLSRLGIATNLVTIFGDDERGVWIKKQLMQNNVNLDQSFIEPKRESNLSSIIVFKQERTILSFHSHGGKDIENIPPAKWLYLTSSPGPNSVGLLITPRRN